MEKMLKTIEQMRKHLDTLENEVKNSAAAAEDEEVVGRIIYWDEDGEDFTDLDELNLKELKKLAKDNDIKLSAKKEDEIRDEIYSAFYPEDAEEEEDEEEAEEVDEESDEDEEDEDDGEGIDTVVEIDGEEVDLAEMNPKELKKFAKDNDIPVKAKSQEGLIQEIIDALYEAAAEEAEEEDEEQDLAEELGLNDMDLEELAELCTEHGLSAKGKKQALIDRILKAIEDGDIDLEEEEGE